MFRAFSRPSSGAQWLQWQPMVLPSYRGDSRAVFVVGPAGASRLHQVGDLFELNLKLRCQKVNQLLNLFSESFIPLSNRKHHDALVMAYFLQTKHLQRCVLVTYWMDL